MRMIKDPAGEVRKHYEALLGRAVVFLDARCQVFCRCLEKEVCQVRWPVACGLVWALVLRHRNAG